MTNSEYYIDPMRALKIIEGLVIEKSDEGGLWATIYRIAHAGTNPGCNKNHPDFVKTAYDMERQLVEDMTIPEWKDES